ncbi:MAG: DUF2076 domain-containing protein [Verrucomicrobiaceae bacterium]|nr:DUF2076 domain-containing protein [Verrucomicrobiaceae bacterium]
MKRAAASSLALCCIILCTGMSKKPAFTISVHGEGSQEDNPRMVFPETVGGQRMIFKLVPEFSHANIAAFHPFPAADGNGYGVTLKLDFRGANALELATRMKVGQVLLSKVNGKSVDLVTIDRPVTDGIFTIWSGVPGEVIQALEKEHPHINQSRSAGNGIEMTATTKKEKRDEMRRIEAEKKKKAQGAAPGEKGKGGFFSGLFGRRKPAPPTDDGPLPQGPVTTQIPLEGQPPPPAISQPQPQPRQPDPAQPIPLNEPLPQR